jgi:hypothetical protein
VTKATDIAADQRAQTKATIEALVYESLKSVVRNRSAIWHAEEMAFRQGPDPYMLQNREAITSKLRDLIISYNLKHLFARNLFMVSLYHGNPVSTCLDVLDAYSPEAIVTLASDRLMQQTSTIADEFTSAVTKASSYCEGHSLHPELLELKRELGELH